MMSIVLPATIAAVIELDMKLIETSYYVQLLSPLCAILMSLQLIESTPAILYRSFQP
jgi:hypothetical protein